MSVYIMRVDLERCLYIIVIKIPDKRSNQTNQCCLNFPKDSTIGPDGD